jgi:chromate transport protein ChrA
MEDLNLSKILGIDEDQVKKAATTIITVVGIYLCSIPLMLFIVIVFLLFIFIRLGKIRKELRAKNELEGIFVSKRRKKKADKERQSVVVVKKKDVSKDKNMDKAEEKKT